MNLPPPRSQSVNADSDKLLFLRKSLGWTQQDAASRSGYSERLIRKIESGAGVRPLTLQDVLTCYHQQLGQESWELENFLVESNQIASPETEPCPYIQKMRDYYRVIYEERQPENIVKFACKDIRFTGEGTTRIGAEVLQQRARTFLDAFNPIKFTIDRIQSHSQIVSSFWTVEMTHVGSFLGIDRTDRCVKVRGNSLVVFAEGFAVEAEDQFDVDDLLQQLQGLPPRII